MILLPGTCTDRLVCSLNSSSLSARASCLVLNLNTSVRAGRLLVMGCLCGSIQKHMHCSIAREAQATDHDKMLNRPDADGHRLCVPVDAYYMLAVSVFR